jgi:hypothetical protein
MLMIAPGIGWPLLSEMVPEMEFWAKLLKEMLSSEIREMNKTRIAVVLNKQRIAGVDESD